MNSLKIKDFFYKILCGGLLGTTIIAPGVSSSVMAVIMGIYDELIEIVSNPFKNLKKNIIYLIPIGIGALLSVLLSLQALNWLFANYEIPSYMLFIGLIVGSLPTVYREAAAATIKKKYFIGAAAAFIFAVFIGLLKRYGISITADTTSIVYLSVSGAIAGIASMTPGMSISMILMLLGVYKTLLSAASGFDLAVIIPVCICFGIGMVLFSNITKYVFNRFRGLGYMMVFGFMLGSIISIFPGLPKDIMTIVLSAIALAAGLFISFLFQKLGKSLKREAESEK